MHRRHLLATLALVPFGTARAAAPLRVTASFSILADLARQIAGPLAAVDSLVPPDGDAHEYQPRPHDLRILLQSALLIRNGLGLEGWMDRLTGAAGYKGPIVTAAEHVAPRTMSENGRLATDPHAWQDPRNAIVYVQAIAAGLATADPANATMFAQNAQAYAGRIAETDAWIQTALEAIPPQDRRIVTTHDAFGYYGARYGIEFLAAEGINPDTEPSARAIAALVHQIKRNNIHAVFIENMTSPRMAEMLARETGAILGGTVYSDALSPAGGPAATYLDMLRHNTTLFAAAMKR